MLNFRPIVTNSKSNSTEPPEFVEVTSTKHPGKRCTLLYKYQETCAERIKTMEVYSDDIWVISFPKCGTSWTIEMVWLINNNMNFEEARSKDADEERCLFLELQSADVDFHDDMIDRIKNLPRPRHIKSHLPFFLLPDMFWDVKPKMVYVTRDPKDAAVSLYHHIRHLSGFKSTKEVFCEIFLSDRLPYTPFLDHVMDYWNLCSKEKILFLSYEEMKMNLRAVIGKTLTFFDKTYSEEQIDELCDHLSFDSMKNNETCNKQNYVEFCKNVLNRSDPNEKFSFIRKGVVGDHANEFSIEMIKKFDDHFFPLYQLKSKSTERQCKIF